MSRQITLYLLITLILSLALGQLLRFELWGVPIYIHDLIIIVILLINTPNLRLVSSQAVVLIALGTAIGWLRAFTLYPLDELLIPSLYTVRLFLYLTIYMLLKKQEYLVERSYFLIAGLVTAIIGLTQYMLMPDMRWAQTLGWDDHLNRLTLPHFDPTFTGIMLGLALLLTKGLPSILYIITLALTYSRSVWLSLLVTLFVTYRNKLMLITLVLLSTLIITLLPSRFGEGTNLKRLYSVSSRLNHDISIIKDLRLDLLTGRGLNTFAIPKVPTVTPNNARGPNNSYLFILSTCGLLGLIGWIKLIYELFEQSHNRPSIVFILVASLFNNVLFYPFVLVWLILQETIMAPSES